MNQLPQQGHSSNENYKRNTTKKFLKSPTEFSNYQPYSQQHSHIVTKQKKNQPLLNNIKIAHLHEAEMLKNHSKKLSEILQRQPTQAQGNKNKLFWSSNNKMQVKNNIDLRLLLSLKRRESFLNQKEEELRIKTAATHLNDLSNAEHDVINAAPYRRRRSYSSNRGLVENNLEDDNIDATPSCRRRRSYSLNRELVEENSEHDNIDATPSCSRRRSYSYDRELVKDNSEADNIDATPSCSRRRSYSSDRELVEDNSEDDNIDATPSCRSQRSYNLNRELVEDNSEHGNINTSPSCSRRSYSFNREVVEDESEDDESQHKWLEHLNYKNYDTKQDNVNQLPVMNSRRKRSFSCEKTFEDEGVSWCESLNKHNKTKHGLNRPHSYGAMNSKVHTDEEADDENNLVLNEKDWKSHGNKKALEKEVLRNILEIDKNVNIWYIVTDSYVLLNNTNFLSNILNADEQCRLIIPETVINKIQSASNSRSTAPASRALHFICQLNEANLAIIFGSTGLKNSNEDIINCCTQLIAETGSYVVIITGDIELYNINTTNIPMFMVAEIKQLLKETNSGQQKEKGIKQFLKETKSIGTQNRNVGTIPDEILHYKITIPNKRNIESDKVGELPSVTKPSSDIKPDPVVVERSDRQACDVGVQADCATSPNTDDNNKEIILPDSSKTNDICSSLSRNKRKILLSRKRKTALAKYTGTDDVVTSNSLLTDSTTNDSSLSSVDNITWGLYRTSAAYLNNDKGNSGKLESYTASVPESEKSEPQTETRDDNVVMFTITDERMREVLTLKCDEWVARLVQIMEEALGRVLRLEAACADVRTRMPPPWTLLEATECIKKCFMHGDYVVDAANKFLKNSTENSALRSAFIMRSNPSGTIKSNISPQNFMELYSYAVYLIDSLQGILMDNEDIKKASKSLSKLLLSDIQEASIELNNQDPGAEVTVREAIVTEGGGTSKEIDKPDDKIISKGTPKLKKCKSPSASPLKYNLRSQSKKSIEMNQEDSDSSSVRNDTESSFFSSLYLRKNTSSPKDRDVCQKTNPNELKTSDENTIVELATGVDDMNVELTPRDDAHMQDKSSSPSTSLTDHWLASYSTDDISTADGARAMIDNDLRRKSNVEDDKEPCASVYGDDNYANDYLADDYVTNSGYIDFSDDILYNYLPFSKDTALNASLNNSDNVEFESDIVTFKEVMGRLQSDILNAYTTIHSFCAKSCESLHGPKLSKKKKRLMKMTAENLSSYIHQICDRLNMVLIRDKSNKNIFKILERKEFEDIAIEANDAEMYRNFITDCLEQGNLLKESVTLLLESI